MGIYVNGIVEIKSFILLNGKLHNTYTKTSSKLTGQAQLLQHEGFDGQDITHIYIYRERRRRGVQLDSITVFEWCTVVRVRYGIWQSTHAMWTAEG